MQSLSVARPARTTAVSRVHGAILRRIENGELGPGTRLREEEVARRHGVSRTPVREAFRWLQAEGLVTVLPHVGAQVSDITLAEIDELFEIRGALEVLAVQRAARNADARLRQGLRTQLRRCEAAVSGRGDRLIAENERLHSLMYEAARSPQLVQLIESLGTRLRRARVASLSLADRPAQALDEHRALAAAVIARDVAKARVLAADHAERGRRAATNWYLEHHRVTGTNGGGRS